MRVPSPLSCWIGVIWLAALVKTQILACPSLDNLFTNDSVLTRANDTVGKDYNCLKLIFEDDYSSVSANAFAGMPELREIQLTVTNITTLPPGLFNETPMLLLLYLENNNITALPLELFNGTPELQRLQLENNKITALPSGIFSNSVNLIFLDLQGNQLQCCEITGLLGLPDGVWPYANVICNLNETVHTLQNAAALLALYPNSCPCSNASNCAVQGTACVSGQTFKQCSNCSTGFYLNDTICSACSDASNCEEQGTACVSGETYKKCSTCSAGFYLNEIGACSGCLAGNECNNSMSTACPNGTYSAANASSCTTIQPGYYCLSYNLDHGCTAISVSNSQAASASSSTLVMVAAVIAGILLVGA